MDYLLEMVRTHIQFFVVIIVTSMDCLCIVFVVIIPDVEGWVQIPVVMLFNFDLIVNYIVFVLLYKTHRGYLWCHVSQQEQEYRAMYFECPITHF